MSRLSNFLKNLNDPKDAGIVAAKLGIKDLQAVMNTETPPANISGNQNNTEVKKMKDVVLGHQADGTPVTQKDQERDLYGWFARCSTFTETGSAVYELTQHMTMNSAAAGICNSNSDLDAEIKRTKTLLAAVD
jgi:hypothetical protein